MAFDKNQLFDDGSTTITQNGKSPEKLLVGPGEYDITMIVTDVSTDIVVKVEESQDGTTFNDLASFPEVSAPGIYHIKVQTQKEYLQLDYEVGSTAKLVAGVTRGRDGGANA